MSQRRQVLDVNDVPEVPEVPEVPDVPDVLDVGWALSVRQQVFRINFRGIGAIPP